MCKEEQRKPEDDANEFDLFGTASQSGAREFSPEDEQIYQEKAQKMRAAAWQAQTVIICERHVRAAKEK